MAGAAIVTLCDAILPPDVKHDWNGGNDSKLERRVKRLIARTTSTANEAVEKA